LHQQLLAHLFFMLAAAAVLHTAAEQLGLAVVAVVAMAL
jgi:hypothetical protein